MKISIEHPKIETKQKQRINYSSQLHTTEVTGLLKVSKIK